MCVIGCPARDMLLEMQYLSKSAIIAGGGGRNEEQGEMKAKYRYLSYCHIVRHIGIIQVGMSISP